MAQPAFRRSSSVLITCADDPGEAGFEAQLVRPDEREVERLALGFNLAADDHAQDELPLVAVGRQRPVGRDHVVQELTPLRVEPRPGGLVPTRAVRLGFIPHADESRKIAASPVAQNRYPTSARTRRGGAT